MYPLSRFISVITKARKKSKIDYDQPSTIQFRCRPWDLDMFNEMNNGRVLTLYDLGRFDLSVRCGLLKTLQQNKWAIVVAGSSVRYRKRIKAFNKICMHSQLVGFDDKWLYISQSMWVGENACSSVLIRGGVTGKNGLIPPKQVIQAMGTEYKELEKPLWVSEWIDSELHRPWPPNVDN